ncbi:MAG TPA: type II secretion system F family protein [Burkholderiales bacterium]|nr:type II secretion system F family protein [Burkholderiales bacterium]
MRFDVKAFRDKGRIVSLRVDAMSAAEASLGVERQGYSVLGVGAHHGLTLALPRRRARFPLLLFSQELHVLLGAGLSLIEAMETLAEKEAHSHTREILAQIIGYLYEGRTFSYALEQSPSVFPMLYVAMVRAAEKTGDLSEALTRFIAYQTQIDQVRKKIVSASIYPVLLMAVGGLVVIFLMAYVVPRFSGVYETAGRDLPWLSQRLLDWGSLLRSNGASVLAAAIAVAAALGFGLSRLAVRQWIAARLWRIPALGERLRVYQLARMFRAVAMLLKGGIPIVSALAMVHGLLRPALKARLQLAIAAIREGQPTSQALNTHELTTPVALRLLRVGERSGNMGDMMERIANFHDEEMARWVEWFTRLFEPLLMTLIGLVIGIIVVLMYMPIFELAGVIQ